MQNQIYDKTLKTLFEESLKGGILLKEFQKNIQSFQPIDTVSKRPKELRVDFALKLTPVSDVPYILHLEFQSNYKDDLPYRMLRYYEALSEKNKMEVEQILVYVGGKTPKNLADGLMHKNLQFKYQILNMSQLSFEKLLNSESPSEIG
jgi:hypothetical protein